MGTTIRPELVDAIVRSARHDPALERLLRVAPQQAIASLEGLSVHDRQMLTSRARELSTLVRAPQLLASLDASERSALQALSDYVALDDHRLDELRRYPESIVARCPGLSPPQEQALRRLGRDVEPVLRESQRARKPSAPLLGASHLTRVGVDEGLIQRIVAEIGDEPKMMRTLRAAPAQVFERLRNVNQFERQALVSHAREIGQIIINNSTPVGTGGDRFGGLPGTGLTTRGDPGLFLGLRWLQVAGTIYDPEKTRYQTGRVMDIVVTAGNEIAVAADRGGVWRVFATGEGEPISDWLNPDLRCVETGPYDAPGFVHLYAGGSRLYESVGAPSLHRLQDRWEEIGTTAMGTVWRVAVDRDANILYVACSAGVAWAPIPPPNVPPSQRVYDWSIARGTAGISMYGIAVSRNDPYNTVVASSLNPPGGIFASVAVPSGPGGFTRATLRRPTVSQYVGYSFDASVSRTISLAAVVGREGTLYAGVTIPDAASKDPKPSVFGALLKSTDGGFHWDQVPVQDWSDLYGKLGGSGDGGDANTTISAARGASDDLVVIGWLRPMLSQDGGLTWAELGPGMVHDDVRGSRFQPTGASAPTLFLATDGGLFSTSDWTNATDKISPSNVRAAWVSRYNANLDVFEFGNGNQDATDLKNFGVSPVSSGYATNGLFAAGLQDNGVVIMDTRSGPPWRQFSEGDGGSCIFLADGALVFWDNVDDATRVVKPSIVAEKRTLFNRSHSELIPVGTSTGLHVGRAKLQPVADPPSGGPLAFAAAAVFVDSPLSSAVRGSFDPNRHNYVYALYADPDPNSVAGYYWSQIAELGQFASGPETVTAVGYAAPTFALGALSKTSGTTVTGRLFGLIPGFPEFSVKNPRGGSFDIVEIVHGTGRFAAPAYLLINGSDGLGQYGFVLSLSYDFRRLGVIDGLPTGGNEHLFGLAYDEVNDALFVASESSVYRRNSAGAWSTATWGLPANPKCQGLVWERDLNGGSTLYMTTAARSMWRARTGT